MTTMEMLRAARNDLQQEIIASIKTFESKTGFTPNSVEITMVDTTRIGESSRRYGVGAVNVGIEL